MLPAPRSPIKDIIHPQGFEKNIPSATGLAHKRPFVALKHIFTNNLMYSGQLRHIHPPGWISSELTKLHSDPSGTGLPSRAISSKLVQLFEGENCCLQQPPCRDSAALELTSVNTHSKVNRCDHVKMRHPRGGKAHRAVFRGDAPAHSDFIRLPIERPRCRGKSLIVGGRDLLSRL